MFKFYSEIPGARLREMLADLSTWAWVALWTVTLRNTNPTVAYRDVLYQTHYLDANGQVVEERHDRIKQIFQPSDSAVIEIIDNFAPDTFASATITSLYKWQLSEATTLNEHATITTDVAELGNWRLQNGLNLAHNLTRLLAIRFSHELKHVNRPVPGFRKTDTVISAALVTKF